MTGTHPNLLQTQTQTQQPEQSKGSETRDEAVSRIVKTTISGIAEGTGIKWLPSKIDVVISTSILTDTNGRFLLPDDVDEKITENYEIRFSLVPVKES